MANIYVRSTTGADVNSGADWANAKATLAGASAIDAAGDTIYVSQAHAESNAGNQNHNWAGTVANPVRVICGNDGATPPTAVSTAGACSTTGVASINMDGAAYTYGISYTAGNGASVTSMNFLASADGNNEVYENCQFILGTTAATSAINLLPTNRNSSSLVWTNCNLKFGNSARP